MPAIVKQWKTLRMAIDCPLRKKILAAARDWSVDDDLDLTRWFDGTIQRGLS
jgi:hypothetical protein